MPIPRDAEFFGIQFKLGAFMPDLPVPRLVDRDLTFPSCAVDTFRLGGSNWEIPDYENVEVFVGRLARKGLIDFDPIVAQIMEARAPDLSRRSKERRVRVESSRPVTRHSHMLEIVMGKDEIPEKGGNYYDAASLAESLFQSM